MTIVQEYDEHKARLYLEAANYQLDQAVQMYFESQQHQSQPFCKFGFFAFMLTS